MITDPFKVIFYCRTPKETNQAGLKQEGEALGLTITKAGISGIADRSVQGRWRVNYLKIDALPRVGPYDLRRQQPDPLPLYEEKLMQEKVE